MTCPLCNKETQVIHTKKMENRIKRRRECPSCLTRFNTYEGLDITSIPEYLRERITK